MKKIIAGSTVKMCSLRCVSFQRHPVHMGNFKASCKDTGQTRYSFSANLITKLGYSHVLKQARRGNTIIVPELFKGTVDTMYVYDRETWRGYAKKGLIFMSQMYVYNDKVKKQLKTADKNLGVIVYVNVEGFLVAVNIEHLIY